MANSITRPRPQTDPHNPQVDMAGRLDVLAARLLKTVVDRSSDPYIKAMYRQYQAVVDAAIMDRLKGADCSKMLRKLGLVTSPPRPVKTAKQTQPKVAKAKVVRMARPVRATRKSDAVIYEAEFVDLPGPRGTAA